MIWPYLQNPKWDARLHPIADWLKGKTKGKVIVDLNCGSAPLLKMLTPDFLLYCGSDKDKEFIKMAEARMIPNTAFSVIDDKDIKDVDRIDILMSIGSGAGEFVQNEYESPTQNKTFLRLAEKNRPEFIVYEAIKKYMDNYLYAMIKPALENMGYKLDRQLEISIPKEKTMVAHRTILLFKHG